MKTTSILVIVYAEATPNPASIKFVVNRPLVSIAPVEFTRSMSLQHAPLAAKLLEFPFIVGVFIASNFVTITKTPTIEWTDVTNDLREFIKSYLEEGNPVLIEKMFTEDTTKVQTAVVKESKTGSEIEEKITAVLEEYIRPAVEQDGGAITFKSFQDGIVTVLLQGACSGCPSSTLTLKAGIENLLKRFIPEVKQVVSEAL